MIDNNELISRLRTTPPNVLKEREAADALEEQAAQIDAALTAGREALATQEQQIDWRRQAVAWIRGKAADQDQTNQKYPRHAECYASWVEKVRVLENLAGELEAEAESSPFGLELWQAAHPEPAPSTAGEARPVYGKPGTRDVDVAEAMRRWDAAHVKPAQVERENLAAALLQSTPDHFHDAKEMGYVGELTDDQIRSIAESVGEEMWPDSGDVGWTDEDTKFHRMFFASALAAARTQPERVPLTDDWLRERCGQSWVFETAKQWVRMAEAAHGITGGEQ